MNQDPTQPHEAAPRFRPVPWIALQTPQDVEAWIDEHNRCLMENIGPQETGVGVCFTLTEGGNLYLQTSGDAVILDVDAEAEWIAPLISAATQTPVPPAQLWILQDDKLIQLIVGLSSLVASTTLVSGHNFGSRSRKVQYSR
ncbi:hypothetical protein [Massilia sp. TWP1-3-3]|uniref:hypothetical protein n=1 Tax=Massilia sp. TWP1-3-3 TaxID=2804573 RepID=UPI003CF0C05F